MASPFKVFRKYQKILLVVAGVALMVVFSLGPVFDYLAGSGGSGGNQAVVETSLGTINEYELQRKVQMQHFLNTYLQEAFRLAQQLGGQPTAVPLLRPVTEQEAVRVALLAKKAESLGFQVSDRAINDYLTQLTGDAVNKGQFLELLGLASSENRRVSDAMLFEALRENLLATKLEESYLLAAVPTPDQRWKYFLRLNDLVTAELLPVPVEQFLDEVPAPSDVELEKFFNEHKESEKQPHIVGEVLMESPIPGFRRPRKMGFAYVKAEYDAIVDRVADEITNEAIEQYYEANKRQFTRTSLIGEDESEAKPSQEKDPAEKKAGEANDAGDPAGKDAEKDIEGEESSDGPADAAEEPREDTQEKEKPNAEKAADKAGDAPPQPEPGAGGQFFSVADDVETQDPAPAADGSAPDAEPAAPSDPPSDGGEATAAAPPDAAQPAAAPAAAPAAGPAQKEEQPEYQPLDEVKDDIRRELARQAAAEQMRKLLRPLDSQMRGYSRRLARWENLSESDPDKAKKPEMPDMKALAGEAGLETFQTPMFSVYEFLENPLGESIVAAEGVKLFQYAFGDRMKNAKPALTFDIDGNGYVVWVFEEQEPAVPRLEDVREEVVRAYKMIEARKLALEEAKRLARQAQASGKPLLEQFADRKDPAPFVTDPFAWLTQGAVPQNSMQSRPRLSTIDAANGRRVEGADQAFMKAIFDLRKGQVGVAENHANTMMYVARIASHEATQDQLHEHFLAQPGPTLWLQMAQSENLQRVRQSLWDSLQADVQYKQLRQLDKPRDL